MNLYTFTNRRRAKDAIMLLLDKYGTDDTTVFVREGMVYVYIEDTVPDLTTVMHYAQLCQGNLEDFLRLDDISELYKDEGIYKFRV